MVETLSEHDAKRVMSLDSPYRRALMWLPSDPDYARIGKFSSFTEADIEWHHLEHLMRIGFAEHWAATSFWSITEKGVAARRLITLGSR